MNMKLEVNIWQDYGTNSIHLIVIDREARPTKVLNLYTGESIEVAEGNSVPEQFILKLPRVIGDQVLKAFAEALDEKGIKTENDFKIQGLLEATKKHLNDMRRLVFKKP